MGTSSRAASALLLSLLVCVSASQASAAGEAACRAGIGSGFSRYLLSTFKARFRCHDDVILHRSAAADCVTGEGSDALSRRLQVSALELASGIEKSCSAADWGLLSYPGPCGGDPNAFDATTLASCIAAVTDEAAAGLISVWYPSDLEVWKAVEASCLRTVPRRAAQMVLRELRARLRCMLAFEAAGGEASLDCFAQPPPYGIGTGDDGIDELLLRAKEAWTLALPHSCARADFDELGYGAGCDPPLGADATLIDFQGCVLHGNQARIPELLDIAFPGTPVCGNGILQEGEACDEGIDNSDTTPDACRENCEEPICGDGTADPGNDEECDDGDDQSLDGCTPDCIDEFCGDGITNDQPNEQCDDENSNPNDRCTSSCRHAACGDGILCSDAACTSGPGGGRETCDLGPANSTTGLCKPDCSGYSRSCTLTVGITNNANVGAVTYELGYRTADGDFVGSAGAVECDSLVTGALASFHDNESKRLVKESLIVDSGLPTPAPIARCEYVTNDASLAASAFSFSVQSASDTQFNPIAVSLAVTNVDCD